MIDEIINYHDLSEQEKDKAISQLEELGFTPACGGINRMKTTIYFCSQEWRIYWLYVFDCGK